MLVCWKIFFLNINSNYQSNILKAEYSRLPLLSISYYATEIKYKIEDDSFDYGHIENLEQTFLSSYTPLLLCANTTIENSVTVQTFNLNLK